MRAFRTNIPANRGLQLATLAAALLLSGSGLAQVAPDELARRHFDSAAAYFEQAEYEEALAAFQKAYELSNRPQILRNISIVQERLGNLAGAVSALDEYLEKAGDDPAIETMRLRRDNLRERLERQRADEATQEVTPPVAVEEAPVNKAEPGAAAKQREGLPPESHYPRSNEPDLAPAYILLSVGGLAGAGALLTGIVSKLEYDKLESGCNPVCEDRELETSKNLATASTVLTGVSIVSLGAGLIWWLSADSGHEQVAQSSINVNLTQQSGFATARFSF